MSTRCIEDEVEGEVEGEVADEVEEVAEEATTGREGGADVKSVGI